MQSGTVLVWLGVVLIFGGILFSAAQAAWRGRFSRADRSFTGSGLGLRSNWPGLLLIALGIILLLARAAAY